MRRISIICHLTASTLQFLLVIIEYNCFSSIIVESIKSATRILTKERVLLSQIETCLALSDTASCHCNFLKKPSTDVKN